ncbi:MAG: type VI secretion system tube protein Hcp [Proteobacteria bacterium]|nr:type VI secretion system tube protein Hcp [Pseudomonadota bacterium]
MKNSIPSFCSFIIMTLSLAFTVSIAETAEAAAYIKFDGISGEAQDKDHKNWSDMLTFSQTMEVPGEGSGDSRRRGKAVCEHLTIAKELDRISPKVAEALLKGRVFSNVTIHLTASYTDAGRVTYYTYELKNVRVIRYNIVGSGQAENVPREEFVLAFEEIKVIYKENDNAGKTKGTIEYSWKN